MSLMFLLPNHKCPSRDCPFHASELDSKKKLFEAPTESLHISATGSVIDEGGKVMRAPPPKMKIRKTWNEPKPDDDVLEPVTQATSEDDVATVLSIDTGNESQMSDYEAHLTIESLLSPTEEWQEMDADLYVDTGNESMSEDGRLLGDEVKEEVYVLPNLEKIAESDVVEDVVKEEGVEVTGGELVVEEVKECDTIIDLEEIPEEFVDEISATAYQRCVAVI